MSDAKEKAEALVEAWDTAGQIRMSALDQIALEQAVEKAIEQARRDALEEAAKVCVDEGFRLDASRSILGAVGASICARAIRSLSTTPGERGQG